MLCLPRMFRSIKNRNYQLNFFGQLVSLLGNWLQSVAQAWLMYRLTGSSLQLGLVVFHRASAAAVPLSYRWTT
jgi:hypothetical protein